MSPSTALSEGGTPLTVHGGGFSSASESLGVLTCRVGGAVVRAVWASGSALVCNATRAAAGESRVEVGRMCKRLLDAGRLCYLQEHGYAGGQCAFVEQAVSPENVLIFAQRT